GRAAGIKLLAVPVRAAAGVKGFDGWRNPGPSGTPVASANPTDKPITVTTLTIPAHSVAVHPSPTSGVAVGWKSPVTGTVRVRGRVVDGDDKCGDGVDWRLSVRSDDGARQLAAGSIPNGGTQGLEGAAPDAVSVRPGDVLELAVLPKGEYSCD